MYADNQPRRLPSQQAAFSFQMVLDVRVILVL